MKPREPRRKVLIRARMRVGTSWCDVCILNLSKRGMQLQAADPPPRASYAEIRRGLVIVIGQVIWSRGHRFGLRVQDPLPVDALLGEPAVSARATESRASCGRRAPRKAALADRSRMMGRALEFACIGCLVALASTASYGAAHQALARPLAAVSGAFGD